MLRINNKSFRLSFLLGALLIPISCAELERRIDPVVPLRPKENEPKLLVSIYDAVVRWERYRDKLVFIGGYFSAPNGDEAPLLYTGPNSRNNLMIENGYQLSNFEDFCKIDTEYLDGKLVYVTGVGGRLPRTLWYISGIHVLNPSVSGGSPKLEFVCKPPNA